MDNPTTSELPRTPPSPARSAVGAIGVTLPTVGATVTVVPAPRIGGGAAMTLLGLEDPT